MRSRRLNKGKCARPRLWGFARGKCRTKGLDFRFQTLDIRLEVEITGKVPRVPVAGERPFHIVKVTLRAPVSRASAKPETQKEQRMR